MRRDASLLIKPADRAVDAEPAEDFAPLVYAVRSAMQAELADLCAEGGRMRRAMRSEMEAALKSWGAAQTRCTTRQVPEPRNLRDEPEPRPPEGMALRGQSLLSNESPASMAPTQISSLTEQARGHSLFHDIQNSFTPDEEKLSMRSCDGVVGVILGRSKWLRTRLGLDYVEEPHRSGCFARLVMGSFFEVTVCLVIFLNCAFMVSETNHHIQNNSKHDDTFLISNVVFQAFYTIELVMKLVVHRQWFFINTDWKTHMFELGLVVSGFVWLSLGSRNGSWPLRMLRLGRLGQVIRVVRIIIHLRHLRTLVLCIQGSVMSLFWSLLMLLIVHGIFALFIMQSVTAHLQGTGESLEESIFGDFFGSVETSILTLYMASTGGEDWNVAYGVVSTTGKFGSGLFLLFLAFVQFAIINIILSIFVNSAMEVISGDSMFLAEQHCCQEAQHAGKLAQLCHDVDSDDDGSLTQTEFSVALQRKYIPTVLAMLGIQRHRVMEVFNILASEADDEKVDIDMFVKACMLLKGHATNFEVHHLSTQFARAQLRLDKRLEHIQDLLHDTKLSA